MVSAKSGDFLKSSAAGRTFSLYLSVNTIDMKKTIFSILFLSLFSLPGLSAQERCSMNCFSSFKHCFTPEGRAQWSPAISLSTTLLIYANTTDLAFGIRMDEKRIWGLGVGLGRQYNDSVPGTEYYVPVYIWNRHYYPVGKKRVNAFFCDLRLGAAFFYQVTGKDDDFDDSMADEGDVLPIIRFAPGLKLRIYQSFSIMAGPFISNEGFGFHFGFAF